MQGRYKLFMQFHREIICQVVIVRFQFNERFLQLYHKFVDKILISALKSQFEYVEELLFHGHHDHSSFA